jgi:hypothetical protein
MTKVKHDRLLAALIAKLPIEIVQWSRSDRIAWLRMMAMAFDVVYGPCGGVRIAIEEARDVQRIKQRPLHSRNGEAAPPGATRRFYVDRDGFAMGDGRPIAMEDLPTAATLWDERAGVECGDVAAILWRDIGTSRQGLPPDVTLRPIFDAS